MRQLLFFVLLCLGTQLSAQLIVIKSATRQGYAAGCGGSFGVYYVVTFRVTQPRQDIQLDSVRFEGRTFVPPKVIDNTLYIQKDDSGATYTVHEIVRWHRMVEPFLEPGQTDPSLPQATLYYRRNGVRHGIVITELAELMPIPYP